MGRFPFMRMLLLICISICAVQTHAQLTAAFSADKTEGCAPLTAVRFTDQSTGNITSWQWDLGNGTNSSLQNPATSYVNPGVYTVKLTVSDGTQSNTVTKTGYIKVYASPVAQLSASATSGCFPLNIRFQDLSQAGDGSLTGWEWDFGDGTTGTTQNPAHVYTAQGNYNVSLRVKNSFGCTNTISNTNYIQISTGVQSDFTLTAPNNCKPPTTINFTAASAGTGTLSYVWDFGDGTNAATANPSHTYNNTGSYTVTLITRNNTGCADTLKKVNAITIGSVQAGFNSPATICAGVPFSITNTSSPAPSGATWNFGDGNFSVSLNPVKTYYTPGNYTVTLNSNFGACNDVATQSIQVLARPAANFSGTNTSSCQPPLTTSFTQTVSGAVGFKWLFGDGSTSTDPNPQHTYTSPGEYDVTLIATNAIGCSDTIKKINFVRVKLPVVSLSNVPQQGCAPYKFSPGYLIYNGSIEKWEWDFGDGGTATEEHPEHTYTTAGTYTLKLKYTTTDGCTGDVTILSAVKVGNKPVVNFIGLPPDVCAFRTVSFTDQSTGPQPDQWIWSFGDGGSSFLQNPSHLYQDTGYFTVKLIVGSNGCTDTLIKTNYIHIKPPIARFYAVQSCNAKLSVNFTDNSIGANSWSWNFGDGSTSTDRNPVHQFAQKGTYNVSLTVKNDTCEHTTVSPVVIVVETADFSVNNTTPCRNTPIQLTALNSDPRYVSYYIWTLRKNGAVYTTLSGSTPNFALSEPGTYTVQLDIVDVMGCRSSVTKTDYITVYGPTADFLVTANGVCTNTTVVFNDLSKTDGTNTISKWIWSYGDGTSDTLTAPPFSHQYAQAGNFNTQLTVIDNIGCSHSVIRYSSVFISKPQVLFISPDSLSCEGKPVQFTNQSSGNTLTWQWNFGDGTASAATTPSHTFSAEGDYTIKLKATDRYGCSDSLTKTAYIRIHNPKALFAASKTEATCPPLVVDFTNQSTNSTRLRWDFGDGTSANVANPTHFYTYPGVYTAKLIVTGNGGCVDTFKQVITVRGPRGSFTYNKASGCEPVNVQFTGTTSDDIVFVWDFNDGNIEQTADARIAHAYTAPGAYLPKMILVDPQGCRVPINGTDSIYVYGAKAKFGLSRQTLCDSGLVKFYDSTIANEAITSYKWTFGDGSTSITANPSHFYTQPGNYEVILNVTTRTGCTSTTRVSIPIKIVPTPIVAIKAIDTACVPATMQFNGDIVKNDTSVLRWQWNFGNGRTATQQNPAPVSYTAAGSYSTRLIATNSTGCADTVYKPLTVYPLPGIEAGSDQTICLGNATQLRATGGVEYQWQPTTALSCSNCATPQASPTQNIRYHLTGKSIHGCIATDSMIVQVKKPFHIRVSRGDTLCNGESVQLGASGAELYTWYPSLGLDNIHSDKPKATPGSTITYQVIGDDDAHCFADTGYVKVVVYPIPAIKAGPDQSVAVGSSVTLSPVISPDVNRISWTPSTWLSCSNCASPVAAPKQTITYTLRVTNEGGCTSSDQVTLSVFCDNSNLFMPNTFSPNGDGNNDIFYPRGKGLFRIKTLRIFNRWGEIVFEGTNFDANDASKGWDGRYKNQPAPQDVYVYSIDIICENQVVLNYKGNIALIR